jgi:hypothetical protein
VSTTIDALALRRVLGRETWGVPQPFGPDGWRLVRQDHCGSVIVTAAELDGAEWRHASIALEEMPRYEDLVLLHKAAWPKGGYAYQVFVPPSQHVNIHDHALHLWGRSDGRAVLPEFGAGGTI